MQKFFLKPNLEFMYIVLIITTSEEMFMFLCLLM